MGLKFSDLSNPFAPGGVSGMLPGPLPPSVKTASYTWAVGSGSLQVLSASQGVLTVTLPAATNVPGCFVSFRSSSPSAHVVTASTDAGNTIVYGLQGQTSVTGSNASSATLTAAAGSALTLFCDGVNWQVFAASGSVTFAKGV